jgi:PAS domain S-box-containing protein
MYSIRNLNDSAKIKKKIFIFIATALSLVLVSFIFRNIHWHGNAYIHTVSEVIFAFLSLFISIVAFVQYYNTRDNVSLFIGSGYGGTFVFALFSAFSGSPAFYYMFPSELSVLVFWNKYITTIFLSAYLYMSFVACFFKSHLKKDLRLNESYVYAVTILFIIVYIQFIVFSQMPFPCYHNSFIIQPQQLIPAFIIFITLIGYFVFSKWKTHDFEYWVILSLIINLIGQIFSLPFSREMFDVLAEYAYVLNLLSCCFLLTGLILNVYNIFKMERYNEKRITSILNNMIDGVITVGNNCIIQSCNPAMEYMFKYSASEIIGSKMNRFIPHICKNKSIEHLEENNCFIRECITNKSYIKGKKKDGKEFPLEIDVSEINDEDEKLFILVLRDITQRKEIERLKNEFVSMVSHELRTPLTSIRGALGLLTGNVAGELSDKAKTLLDIANNNSMRLIHLINDILDIEKIEAGKMDFVLMPQEIMSVVEYAISLNKAYGQQYGITFEISESLDNAKVYVDKERLVQVLTNLLSNASKFSHHDSAVKISVSRINTSIRITITDQGIGIPEEYQHKIFEKFAQVDSSDTRQKGGTGLGLSISKAIIEKMGGIINFTSQKDQGSKFYFELPEYIEKQTSFEEHVIQNYQYDVLVCEDDFDVATIITRLLDKIGCRCTIANGAAQAKQLLVQKKYDFITMDLILADQSGISFIKELHKADSTKNIPIIVISVKAQQAVNELEGDYMVVDWVSKPIDEVKLSEAVDKIKLCVDSQVNKPSILHIEDDPDIEHIVSALTRDIANISCVKSYAEAKKRILQENFDLVIVDFELPDGNGLNLIDDIKKNNQTSIIIFSAHEIREEYTRKVDAFLLKSLTSNEKLIDTIKTLMNIKKSKL